MFGWASPYFGHHLPGFSSGQLIYAFVGDVLLLISLFVLGGDFWDKLHSLFRYNAYAIFPDTPARDGSHLRLPTGIDHLPGPAPRIDLPPRILLAALGRVRCIDWFGGSTGKGWDRL